MNSGDGEGGGKREKGNLRAGLGKGSNGTRNCRKIDIRTECSIYVENDNMNTLYLFEAKMSSLKQLIVKTAISAEPNSYGVFWGLKP